MAPMSRKPLKHKGAVLVPAATKDAVCSDRGNDDSGNDDHQSTKKTTSVQKRRVAKKKQTPKVRLPDTAVVDSDAPKAKVSRRTKQSTVSCSQKTNSKSAREKPKNSKSDRVKDVGADSVPTGMKQHQRLSKTQAQTRINRHFEDKGGSQSDDVSALEKEIKIWGEITGTQKRESGMIGKKTDGKPKHDDAGENKKQEGELGNEVNKTEEVPMETQARKGKGKRRVGNKSAVSVKERRVKKEEEEEEEDTAGDVESYEQEPAKGNKYIGAHTSIAGGLCNAVLGAVEIGAKAFGLFLRNQRQWLSKPMSDKDISDFKTAMKNYGFSPNMVVPHGSYLMNCGSPKDELLQKSRDLLLDELQRCEQLGLVMFNFHPGSTCGEISREESIERIAASINYVHSKTKYAVTVLENMCCQGNTIGGNFTELRGIIDLVEDKTRIGVCIDTCHAFAAGYNLKSEDGYNTMMTDLEDVIGLKYLKAVHMNDSKGKVGCHLDRHENIGRGHIGLECFRRLVNDPRFDNIPFILETPADLDDAKEVRILYALIEV